MAMAADDRVSAVPEVAVGPVAAGRQVDPTLGVSVPAWAVVTVGGHRFWCDELEDWRRCLALAGMAGGLVQVPVGIPGEYWMDAARAFARLVLCSCGERTLDPDHPDALNLGLCPACYDLSGWENTHCDRDHRRNPDPDCPLCRPPAAPVEDAP